MSALVLAVKTSMSKLRQVKALLLCDALFSKYQNIVQALVFDTMTTSN